MSNTPLVKTIGCGKAARRRARSARGHSLSRKVVIAAALSPAARARRSPWLGWAGPGPHASGRPGARVGCRCQRGGELLAVAVQLLDAGEAALHEQAQVVQDAIDDLVFPDR